MIEPCFHFVELFLIFNFFHCLNFLIFLIILLRQPLKLFFISQIRFSASIFIANLSHFFLQIIELFFLINLSNFKVVLFYRVFILKILNLLLTFFSQNYFIIEIIEFFFLLNLPLTYFFCFIFIMLIEGHLFIYH